MAKLYITEYEDKWSKQAADAMQVVREPPVVDQTPLAIAASAAPSSAFNARTTLVRLHTDAVCSFAIGPVGTVATANSQRMAANQTEYKLVTPGHIVSVITNT
jgi:hypothetical protein